MFCLLGSPASSNFNGLCFLQVSKNNILRLLNHLKYIIIVQSSNSFLTFASRPFRELVLENDEKNQPSSGEVLDALLKECKKDNPLYKVSALEATGPVLESFKADRFKDMFDILKPIIQVRIQT